MAGQIDPRMGDGIDPNYPRVPGTVPQSVISQLEQLMGCPPPARRRPARSWTILVAAAVLTMIVLFLLLVIAGLG